MKQILLTKGKYSLVDNEDFEWLNQWNWYFDRYAKRDVEKKQIRMHRVIMNCPKNMFIDHINHNKLDNRKENLRIVTKTQNQGNLEKRSHNTSGFKGVWFDKARGTFAAEIHFKYKKFFLGRYKESKQAAFAYNVKAKELFGEFALLNEIK